MPPPLGRKELRWALTGRVRRVAAAIAPDVIMERYYNFAGEGISAEQQQQVMAVLQAMRSNLERDNAPAQRTEAG